MITVLGNIAFHKIRQKRDQLLIIVDDLKKIKKRIAKEITKKRYDIALGILEKGGYPMHRCHYSHERATEDDLIIQKAECEICLDVLTGKDVYSCKCCSNLICARCVDNVNICPFCRKPGPDFAERNRALERFISKLMLPCKNYRYGCTISVDGESRKLHEKYCPFAPIVCPYIKRCGFAGCIEELHTHLYKLHDTMLLVNNEFGVEIKSLLSELKTDDDKKLSNTAMLYCYEHIFICKATLSKNKLYFSFKQLKGYEDRKRYSVSIEITNEVRCTVKGTVLIPKANKRPEFESPPVFILSGNNYYNDDIGLYFIIKQAKDL